MESSNAWERAQEAIARASERSDDVITPDNAVSPFDASMTTVIPHADVVRRGPPDPDSTQRLPHGRPPVPRRPDEVNGHHHGSGQYANGYDRFGGDPYAGAHREPPPRPPEMSDPALPRVTGLASRPPTAPFPAAEPYPADDGTPPQGFPSTPPVDEPRRPWWKRLFGR